MKPLTVVWIVGIGMIGFRLMTGSSKTFEKSSLTDKLSPLFKNKISQLLSMMHSAGHDAIVFESYRSPERAEKLAEKGTGVVKSQHSLGLAVDIIDKTKLWNASPSFWADLHKFALELRLGRVKHKDKSGKVDWDLPHVQALPGKFDSKMFSLTASQREDFLRKQYA